MELWIFRRGDMVQFRERVWPARGNLGIGSENVAIRQKDLSDSCILPEVNRFGVAGWLHVMSSS